MSKLLRTISAVTLAGLLTILGLVTPLAHAAGTVTLTTSASTVDGGERFTVSVNLDETANFMGIQFSLDFDTDYLEVIQVDAGPVWPIGSTFVAVNEVDNADGLLEFAATLTGDAQTMEGALVTIIFEAKNPTATVTTDIVEGSGLTLVIAGANGGSITPTAPADLPITINPAPTIEGTVTLQASGTGRPVTVNAAALGYQGSAQQNTGLPFSIAVPTGSNYELTASAACHLSAVQSGTAAPSTGNTVTLLAGDVNNDGRVNIQDLAAIGNLFGGTVPDSPTPTQACTDLNQDGVINILDLSLAASNYNKTTSPWD